MLTFRQSIANLCSELRQLTSLPSYEVSKYPSGMVLRKNDNIAMNVTDEVVLYPDNTELLDLLNIPDYHYNFMYLNKNTRFRFNTLNDLRLKVTPFVHPICKYWKTHIDLAVPHLEYSITSNDFTYEKFIQQSRMYSKLKMIKFGARDKPDIESLIRDFPTLRYIYVGDTEYEITVSAKLLGVIKCDGLDYYELKYDVTVGSYDFMLRASYNPFSNRRHYVSSENVTKTSVHYGSYTRIVAGTLSERTYYG